MIVLVAINAVFLMLIVAGIAAVMAAFVPGLRAMIEPVIERLFHP